VPEPPPRKRSRSAPQPVATKFTPVTVPRTPAPSLSLAGLLVPEKAARAGYIAAVLVRTWLPAT